MSANRFITKVHICRFCAWIGCFAVFSMSFAVLFTVSFVSADSQRIIRIGTGGSSGTYFPIGTLIADSLSQHINESDIDHAESSLIILPQRSNGSVANVKDIGAGLLESGLAQADVVHWAFHGIGPFDQMDPMTNLRALATLYFESLHLVAHVDSGIESVADLVGLRVSVDEIGSGTELDVRPILDAFEISNDELKMVFLKPTDSIDRLRNRQLDAFFIVAGYPVSGVSELIEEGVAILVPITGSIIDSLLEEHPFLTIDTIPANAYSNSVAIPTLAVAAQWVISSDVDDELAFDITKQLWSDKTQKTLVQGHQKGKELSLSSALKGIGIPLHTGAQKFYEQTGLNVSKLPY